MRILAAILLGMLLSGIWFGVRTILELISNKVEIKFISRFSTVLAALVPTIIVVSNGNLKLWNFGSIVGWQSWVLVLLTVIVTALVVSKNKPSNILTGKELLWYALDGVLMEVPQRMMMQSFVCLLLELWGIDAFYSALVTAIVWCISICIQCVIMKSKFDKSVVVELLSSFVFSLGVGIVLVRTEFILFTMVAHFMERIVSTEIRRRKYTIK